MNVRSWLNVSGIAAILATIWIIYLIFPESSWNTAFTISAISLGLSVGYIFNIPYIKINNGNDAARMAMIGPQAISVFILLCLTGSSFYCATLKFYGFAYVLDTLALLFLIISRSVLEASTQVIEEVSEKYSQPSMHLKWKDDIENLANSTDNKILKDKFYSLSEDLRYAPSDVTEGAVYNKNISSKIEEINQAILSNQNINLEYELDKLKKLINSRNLALKTARSKA